MSEEDRSKPGEEVHSSWSSHQKLEDPEQIDYESNTYLTIFDNIFKRTIQDLTLRENIKKDLLKVMSKDHQYAYQKLNLLESRANKDFLEK